LKFKDKKQPKSRAYLSEFWACTFIIWAIFTYQKNAPKLRNFTQSGHTASEGGEKQFSAVTVVPELPDFFGKTY
jgi:hypothetical protein